MCRARVRKGGELGAREMVTIHGDEDGDGVRGLGRDFESMEGVKVLGDQGSEGGFA